jgi:aspartate/methionine/tyrosine aminotransferase
MKFRISPHIELVQYPPITEVKSWVAGRTFSPDRPLVDLCQAIPDYPPAPELVGFLRERMKDPLVSKYSPDEGLPEVREAVSAWYGRRYGSAPRPSEICLTVGASQAFWLAMTVLCTRGDEVIVQLPAYFDHPMALQALGVRPVFIPGEKGGAGADVRKIASLVTPRTRAILLVSPSNPTGETLSPEAVRQLFELAREKGIALVLDETYNAFIPEGAPPHALFADPGWRDHFIHLASFGKTFALTGYRAGALVAAEGFMQQALKVQDTMAVCQPRITQHAVAYGCECLDPWVAANCNMMTRRHDAFRAAFTLQGNPFELAASGGFFAWVRHPFAGKTGREAARILAEEAGIICLPGEAFGPGLEGFLRLAFGNIADEEIPQAVERFLQIDPGRQ